MPLMALGAEPTRRRRRSRGRSRWGPTTTSARPFNPTILRARAATAVDRRTLRASAETGLLKLQQLSHDLQDVILPLGVSLSAEKDVDRLLEKILLEAKKLCHADAGTLYVRTKDDRLKFSIMLTDSLGIALGGASGQEITFAAAAAQRPGHRRPNHRNIATHVALHGHSVNIADIYGTEAFDFTGTREFDRKQQLPVDVDADGAAEGQRRPGDRGAAAAQRARSGHGRGHGFDSYQQLVVESLASQAAVVFNNQLLLQRQEELLKFERDLQIGRQIQAGFLPEVLPAPGRLRGRRALHAGARGGRRLLRRLHARAPHDGLRRRGRVRQGRRRRAVHGARAESRPRLYAAAIRGPRRGDRLRGGRSAERRRTSPSPAGRCSRR
jgi:hypothetical protein